MATPLAEPAPDLVPGQLPAQGVAQQAAALFNQEQSAAASLRDGMQSLTPVAAPETTAQQISKQQAAPEVAPAPEVVKRDKVDAPVGTDVREHKQVELQVDTAQPEGSALESFRTGLIKTRNKKMREAAKPAEATETPAPTGETTPVATKPADVKPEEVEAPVTDEEIQKTIDDPAISKRHQKRMIYLSQRAKELEAKLKEAESKPASEQSEARYKELAEKQAKAEEELIRYRRMHSLQDEPEIKKFDEVAASADEAIYAKLKDFKISDNTIKLIKDLGGFDGFSRSGQVYNVNVTDSNGDPVTRQVTAAQLARSWLQEMPVGDAEYIRAKMGERFSAIDNKARRSKELTAEASTWFKNQQEQAQKAQEQAVQTMKENVAAYNKWADEWAAKQEWLKDRAVLPTATDAEKAEIEATNRHNAGVKQLLKAAGAPGTVADYTALIEQAATSLYLRRENTRMQKENEALKEQLAKIQKGVTTTGRPGGASIQTQTKKPEPTISDSMKTSAADSLREGLERLRMGAAGDED